MKWAYYYVHDGNVPVVYKSLFSHVFTGYILSDPETQKIQTWHHSLWYRHASVHRNNNRVVNNCTSRHTQFVTI